MKILTAKTLGCCEGVRNAIAVAKKMIASGEKCCTFGNLIHNRVLTDFLRQNGIAAIDECGIGGLCNGDSVIVRAHGIAPDLRRKIEATGAKIIDATCERVKMSQRRAVEFAKEGRVVILAGEKMHAELLGIAGCVCENSVLPSDACLFVETESDAKNLRILPKKAALMSQTTISEAEFEKIRNVLAAKIADFVTCDMICGATKLRQNALVELCKHCDAVVVIGGKNSSNTKRLYLTAKEHCEHAYSVEDADELPDEIFGFECVGITAGSSTLDETIAAVCERLASASKRQ